MNSSDGKEYSDEKDEYCCVEDVSSCEEDEYFDEYLYEDDEEDECFDEDLYDSDEEDKYFDEHLPLIVIQELEMRKPYYDPTRDYYESKKNLTLPSPADQRVIDELKWFINAGLFIPDDGCGYIEIMQQLGHTPKSTDPFVKDSKLNVVQYGFPGCSKEDMVKSYDIGVKNHKGVVRYLRYREFINHLESKGMKTKDYFRSDEDSDQYVEKFSTDDEEAKNENEDNLDKDQTLALRRSFTSGFAKYIDDDKSLLEIPIRQPGIFNNSEVSMISIIQQSHEIKALYMTQKRPLGHALITKDKIGNNKKKKGRSRAVDNKILKEIHAAQIQKHLINLISCLEACISSSRGFAKVLFEISQMLSKGALFDIAISRCMLCYKNGDLVRSIVSLCHIAAKNAKDADCDVSRQSVGYYWWLAYHSLTEIITHSIFAFVNEGKDSKRNVDDATKVFKEIILPDMLSILQQEDGQDAWFSEERAIWRALDKIFSTLPTKTAISFIRKHWVMMEEKCKRECSTEVQKREFQSTMARTHENFMEPRTIAECVNLISNFCQYSMKLEDNFCTSITAGSLAIKVLKRGIVPLLVHCARSKNMFVATKGIFGLSQISRVKDCRDILFQLPNNKGINFIKELLSSKDFAHVTNAMLLILHLSYDEEWCDPITNIKPPIEQVCLKLAAYSMESLLKKISFAKEANDIENHRAMLPLVKKSFQEMFTGDDIKEDILDVMEKISMKERSFYWQQYECNRTRQDPDILAISRSMMVLSSALMTNNKVALDRLIATDFLHLVGATVDVPIENTHHASFVLAQKVLTKDDVPEPSKFPDPEHFLHTSFEMLVQQYAEQKQPKFSLILLQIIKPLHDSQKWKHIFEAVAGKCEGVKYFLENVIDGLSNAVNEKMRQNASSIMDAMIRPQKARCGYNTLTGRLAKCNNCGKIEGKIDEWKRCSRCMIATYCSRDCQRADWKMHKRVCTK